MSTAIRHESNGKPAAGGTRRETATAPLETRIPPVEFDHEELVVRRGERSGLEVMVAVHSTALGPALGGVRLWHYGETLDGARDALRLARGMTHKAAAAGIELGGGKGVIRAPARSLAGEKRRAALLDFGDLVESLGGRYITAEDVGTSPEDLLAIHERTEHVTGLSPEHGGSGDPSPFTAMGVEAAMRACAREAFGTVDLRGRRIVVAGLGHVGSKLARRLVEAGAELIVSDIDPAKQALAQELAAEWVEPEEEIVVQCDLLAPCALGGAIHAGNVSLLRCRAICGCANNQLADERLAEALLDRGILYAPDFIANAGGLIHVYREIRGYSEEEAIELVLAIEGSVDGVLRAARERGITPLLAAHELARERLDVAALSRRETLTA